MICQYCGTQMERQDEFDAVVDGHMVPSSQYLCHDCGYNLLWIREPNHLHFRTKRGQAFGTWIVLFNPLIDPLLDALAEDYLDTNSPQ